MILAFTTAIRLRIASLPLERDEGEYAYGGQLLLDGHSLYKHLYTMKWPGTHLAYALMMAAFGRSPEGIRLGLIIVNLATAAIVFVIARRALGQIAGAAAAGLYALLSLNPLLLGFLAHATHFVILFALLGIALIQKLDERMAWWRIFGAGLLLGISDLMKQSGACFSLFAFAWIAWTEFKFAPRNLARMCVRLGLLSFGVLLPYSITVAAVSAEGIFQHFWLWTFKYAHAYVSLRTPADGWPTIKALGFELFSKAPVLSLTILAGLFCLLASAEMRRHRLFVLGTLIASAVSVCAGWYFRPHYFLLFVPVAAILGGLAVQLAHGWIARRWNPTAATVVALLVFAGIAAEDLVYWRPLYFQIPVGEFWHHNESLEMFPEAVQVGKYLREHCPEGARIAVLGSEPEIYFYSHRLSATGHVYMYPLLEAQPYVENMRAELIRQIETNRPSYVVWVHESASWHMGATPAAELLRWFNQYQNEHLELETWLEYTPPLQDEWHIAVPGSRFAPRASHWIAIFRRKAD